MNQKNNALMELKRDPRLSVTAGNERMAINGGLQPFAVKTSSGALLAQVQMPEESMPDERIRFHWRIASFLSRDLGATWQAVEQLPGRNEMYMEGGAIELSDGTYLQLDTYITPGKSGWGKGLMLISRDDLRTYEGPIEINVELPDVDFDGKDDGGNPHIAIRFHRRIRELPDGDLLAVCYGRLHGENAPAHYMPSMKRTRCMLVRSSDQGRNWRFVSTIAVGAEVGTEGFCEPDFVRLSQGECAGKLLCYMRTGKELYWCESLDEGKTWSQPKPEQFGIIDVNDTAQWESFFKATVPSERSGRIADMFGAFVDPNLIEMKNGVLACAFGLRIPHKLCWDNASHERNGNYVAFSLDQGESWSHVVQITSGVMTTHYMGIQEVRENELQVMYDIGHWHDGYWDGNSGRYTGIRNLHLSLS